MVTTGLILSIIGVTGFIFGEKRFSFIAGTILLLIGMFIILSHKEIVHYYKLSEYEVKITYKTEQKGDQVVCDTIYEFKKK